MGTELLTTRSGLTLHQAVPDAVADTAVVVIHPAEGVNAYVERVCARLAALGHHVVAPNLFHRIPSGTSSRPSSQQRTAALRHAEITGDLDATFEHLHRAGFPLDRCGIVGFCMGGTVALLAAARYPLRAAVTFYGGGVTQGRWGGPPLEQVAAQLRTPWLGLYGEEDKNIPMSDIRLLAEAASRSGVEQRVITYPGAGHGFHSENRPNFDSAAAASAWDQATAWLARANTVGDETPGADGRLLPWSDGRFRRSGGGVGDILDD